MRKGSLFERITYPWGAARPPRSLRSGTGAAAQAPAAPAVSRRRVTVSPALADPRERGRGWTVACGGGGRPFHGTAVPFTAQRVTVIQESF